MYEVIFALFFWEDLACTTTFVIFPVIEDVAVSERETEILSHTMSVMTESNQGILDAKVADYQLEELCAKNEAEELATHKSVSNLVDKKTRILSDSAEKSTIIECTPTGEVPEEN